MIKRDDRDLFGGRLSVIISDAYSCRVETVGRELRTLPVTLIIDLSLANSAPLPPSLRLTYEFPWGNPVLTGHHQAIVDFLDGLPTGRSEISLASALEIVTREFSHLGNWEWLEQKDPLVRAPETAFHSRVSAGELLPSQVSRHPADPLTASRGLDTASVHRTQMDSPLAG